MLDLYTRIKRNPIYFKFISKVLQPVSNQYNITDKIKEANQELYKGEQHQRSSHPKVRFRDHQLVDFEPDEESVELMERRASISLSTNSSNITINSNIPKIKEEESSDDGYIDEEDEAAVTDGGDRVIVESIEIEEVCEQIEILDAMTVDIVESDNNGGAIDEENYTKDEFHEDEDESAIVTAIKIKPDKKQKKQPPQQQQLIKPQQEKRRGSSKKVFRSKINPSIDEVMVTSATTTTTIELIGERTSATTRKMCCQHKNGYKEKLPKYNGFFSSNYGLSKEELERRSANQLRHNEIQQSREVKKSEQKDHVAKVNEEAFAKW